MKRLNDVTLIPPGGYRWYCRKHGVRFKADFYEELLEKVRVYFEANHLDIPEDFSGHIQNDMCEQNGWGEGTCRSLE